MANWSNLFNVRFSEGLPLPVLRCVPVFRCVPVSSSDLKSPSVYKSLCVSTDLASRTLIIAYDELSLSLRLCLNLQQGKTVNDTMKLTNMTLLDECPLTLDNTDEKNSQVSAHIQYRTNIHKINNAVRPSLDTYSLLFDDNGECNGKLDSWPFTMEIFICSNNHFYSFCSITDWKRIKKEND